MRAYIKPAKGRPPWLTQVPVPPVETYGVLVRVRAASLNAADWKMADDLFPGQPAPYTMGRDFAGVVVAIGPGVTRFAPGDEVFGFVPDRPLLHGSFAEYVSVNEDLGIAFKPEGLGFAEAAALGVAGTTALSAVEAVNPAVGDRVVVVGAAGGVGAFATQLAMMRGAVVLAPTLPEDTAFVSDLGVRTVLDRAADLPATIHRHHPEGVDRLIDLVGGDDFPARLAVLRPGGVAATVARPEPALVRHHTVAGASATPDPEQLALLARYAADGTIRVPITAVHPLEKTIEALTALRDDHSQGKVVITVA